jgi:hypothetical protein
MKPHPLLLYCCGLAVFGMAGFIYFVNIYMLGFPDGYISDAGRFRRTASYVFIVLSAVVGVYFICLGVVAENVKNDVRRRWLTSLVLYAIMVVIIFILS